MMISLQFFVLFLHVLFVLGTELTFELSYKEKQCFYEELEKDVKFEIDYHVIAGGNYDVDCYITDPQKNLLYSEKKRQHDSISNTTVMKGIYEVCFSNEFSTYTHKIVYLYFRHGEEPPLINLKYSESISIALTTMDLSCMSIHENLNAAADSQTWKRLREARDSWKAELFLERVTYWSIWKTILLIVIGIGQVVAVKSFCENSALWQPAYEVII